MKNIINIYGQYMNHIENVYGQYNDNILRKKASTQYYRDIWKLHLQYTVHIF